MRLDRGDTFAASYPLLQRPSFQDGPKDQTRNLKIPGSMLRIAPGMTASYFQTRFRILAARYARVVHQRTAHQRAWALPQGGAGNAGCRLHPQPRAQSVESTRVSHHGRTGTPGIPARNGFNSLFRALLGDRAFLPPSLAKVRRHPYQLDASVGASGPHDFAVRATSFVLSPPHVS